MSSWLFLCVKVVGMISTEGFLVTKATDVDADTTVGLSVLFVSTLHVLCLGV